MTERTQIERRHAPLPRWLWLTVLTALFVLTAAIAWSIADVQTTCAMSGIQPLLPGPSICGPDAQVPALVTSVLLMLALAAAYVVAFVVERPRTLVLVMLSAGMLVVALVGVLVTLAAALYDPGIIYN